MGGLLTVPEAESLENLGPLWWGAFRQAGRRACCLTVAENLFVETITMKGREKEREGGREVSESLAWACVRYRGTGTTVYITHSLHK